MWNQRADESSEVETFKIQERIKVISICCLCRRLTSSAPTHTRTHTLNDVSILLLSVMKDVDISPGPSPGVFRWEWQDHIRHQKDQKLGCTTHQWDLAAGGEHQESAGPGALEGTTDERRPRGRKENWRRGWSRDAAGCSQRYAMTFQWFWVDKCWLNVEQNLSTLYDPLTRSDSSADPQSKQNKRFLII